MSKRNNISYVKPQDPSFLAKLKADIGYTEGPTVDTKRTRLANDEHRDSDSGGEENSLSGRTDELPQVVVLREGDLTADQVVAEQKRLEKEKIEAKADLSKPIVFKQRSKASKKDIIAKIEEDKEEEKKKSLSKNTTPRISKQKEIKNQLSFAYDDDNEEEPTSDE